MTEWHCLSWLRSMPTATSCARCWPSRPSGSWTRRSRPGRARPRARERRCGKFSATDTATATGTRERGGSRLRSRSSGRALFPQLPGTSQHGREGFGGRHPGGLRPRRLDAISRRSGQGDGVRRIRKRSGGPFPRRTRHVQEPGQPPLRRRAIVRHWSEDNGEGRTGERLSLPTAGGRMALSLARCNLCEGARGRADRQPRRDNCGGGQRRRQARGSRRRHRPIRTLPPSARLWRTKHMPIKAQTRLACRW